MCRVQTSATPEGDITRPALQWDFVNGPHNGPTMQRRTSVQYESNGAAALRQYLNRRLCARLSFHPVLLLTLDADSPGT